MLLCSYFVLFVLSFKGIPTIIPTGSNYAFNWNPCTDFTEGNGCTDVLVCVLGGEATSKTNLPDSGLFCSFECCGTKLLRVRLHSQEQEPA